MALRIQFGSPTGRTNAFCYIPLGRCRLIRVAAFAEHSGVSRLFYRLFLDSLRAWARASYLQISSSASWWGRRRRDLRLAPKPPARATSTNLLYSVCSGDELNAFLGIFWHRSPFRLCGTARDSLTAAQMASLMDKQLLEAGKFLAAGDLTFVAERDTWGFFPNVLFAAADIGAVATRLQNAAGVLSSPLQCDESAFSKFPIRFPDSDDLDRGPAGAE
jgi:hypothetical protein